MKGLPVNYARILPTINDMFIITKLISFAYSIIQFGDAKNSTWFIPYTTIKLN